MVLNEIIRGAAGIAVATEGAIREHSTTQEDLKMAVVSIMEEYTSLKNWNLITVSEEMDRDRQDQQVRAVSIQQPGYFVLFNFFYTTSFQSCIFYEGLSSTEIGMNRVLQ